MALIYKIINDINPKVYIGKTEHATVEERFREHLKDYRRRRCEKRPLYNAMRKYGPEHFYIVLLEETDQPEEREMYWIERHDSYRNGYNATLGGDGKKYIDHEPVLRSYEKLQSLVAVARDLGVNEDTVRKILVAHNVRVLSSQEVCANQCSKPVSMYTLDDKYITTFNSMYDAGRYLLRHRTSHSSAKAISSHISDVCNQKRRTAFGYKWKRETSPLLN